MRTLSPFISYPNQSSLTCCDYVLHSVLIVLRPCSFAVDNKPNSKKKEKKKKRVRDAASVPLELMDRKKSGVTAYGANFYGCAKHLVKGVNNV